MLARDRLDLDKRAALGKSKMSALMLHRLPPALAPQDRIHELPGLARQRTLANWIELLMTQELRKGGYLKK
jgi:hypothetical protein